MSNKLIYNNGIKSDEALLHKSERFSINIKFNIIEVECMFVANNKYESVLEYVIYELNMNYM